jgi:cytochrome c oxidase assembly protein subunit 15
VSQEQATHWQPGDPLSVDDARALRRSSRAFASLVAVTWLLIVLGALVRANGAGLACPDWPLCFGVLVPDFDMKIAFEWGHRLLASCVSLAFGLLCIGTLRRPVARRAVAPLLLVGGLLLAAQVVLGGLTVLKLLASWTVTAHLITGSSFAACLAFIAYRLRETSEPARTSAPLSRTAKALLAIAALLLLLQMVLGGLVSSTYAGLACDDWPACHRGEWFPSFAGAMGTHLLHRINGYALVLALALCAFVTRGGAPRLARLTMALLALVVVQLGVGVANVLLRIPAELTGLHTGLGAALFVTMTLALYECWLSPTAVRNVCSDVRPGLQMDSKLG